MKTSDILLSFGIGAVLGSVSVYFVIKNKLYHKFEGIYNEAIDDAKRSYLEKCHEYENKIDEISKKKSQKSEEEYNIYKKHIKEENYADYTSYANEHSKYYAIDSDHFQEKPDYDSVTITAYSDGVYAYDDGKYADEVADIFKDAGCTDDDIMYFRNDSCQRDYEIVKADCTYEDTYLS